MKKVNVMVFNSSEFDLPKYETLYAAGMDVRANESVEIGAYQTKLIPTGLFMAIPEGFEIQARPRSGMSLKTTFRVANSPGTIDADYRGELCIIAWNVGSVPLEVKKGDRIGQIVLQEVPQISWVEVNTKEELPATSRGENGFGSTGK